MIKKLSEEDKLYVVNKINNYLSKYYPKFGKATLTGESGVYVLKGFFKNIPDRAYLIARITDEMLEKDMENDLNSLADYFIFGWDNVDTECNYENFRQSLKSKKLICLTVSPGVDSVAQE